MPCVLWSWPVQGAFVGCFPLWLLVGFSQGEARAEIVRWKECRVGNLFSLPLSVSGLPVGWLRVAASVFHYPSPLLPGSCPLKFQYPFLPLVAFQVKGWLWPLLFFILEFCAIPCGLPRPCPHFSNSPFTELSSNYPLRVCALCFRAVY